MPPPWDRYRRRRSTASERRQYAFEEFWTEALWAVVLILIVSGFVYGWLTQK